jgi:hypothetical protein
MREAFSCLLPAHVTTTQTEQLSARTEKRLSLKPGDVGNQTLRKA